MHYTVYYTQHTMYHIKRSLHHKPAKDEDLYENYSDRVVGHTPNLADNYW